MEQHPVPQNISSYQFHLVGDMTLKQFLELAGGVLVGVLFYATSLPGIIKWPLILISGAIGAALAFVPFEERPLEQWVLAFFRGVYSPTLFHWEKKENVKYFSEPSTTEAVEGKPTPASPFANIPFLSKLETSENSYLSKITNLFNPTTAPAIPVSQPAQVQEVTIRTQPSQPQGQILTAHLQGVQEKTPVAPTSEPLAGQREISVPQTTFISMDKNTRPHVILEETPVGKPDLTTTGISPTLTPQKVEGQATEAMFSPGAAPPSLPTIVNTISGQVMDPNKKIIEGAVLEILDDEGRSIRAMRTNKAGHFLNVTALLPGKYKILTEKEGYNFDPIEFTAKGDIIQPIAIIAHA